MSDFGMPEVLTRPLALLVPLAELVCAAALLPVAFAWWGATGILVLLLLFIAGISVNLVRGRKPDCHCFGQLSSSPIGWNLVLRNGVLAAVAAFIVWQGPEDAAASLLNLPGRLPDFWPWPSRFCLGGFPDVGACPRIAAERASAPAYRSARNKSTGARTGSTTPGISGA